MVLWAVHAGFNSLNLPRKQSRTLRDETPSPVLAMRYILTADFEDDSDIESFLRFVQYHSKRLKCPSKDVFIRLAHEWEKQLVNHGEPAGPIGVKKEKKKTLKESPD